MNIEAAQILEKASPPPQAPPVTDQTPKPDERVSGKLEILIRREQAALQRERQAKQREAELEAKLKAFQERENKVTEFEQKRKNPKEALSLLGLSYDELTQAQLSEGEVPPQLLIKQLREEIEEFKKQARQEKDQEKEQQLESQKKQAEAEERKAIDSFKADINQYITDNKTRYELIEFEQAQELVFDVVDEYYNRSLAQAQKQFDLGEITEDQIQGKIMSMKEAADKVEEHLEQKYNKAKDLSKTKALWGAIPKEAQKQIAKTETKPASPKTLTNQLSARVTQTAPRMLTDQERVQKAIAYARGLRP